MRSKALSIPVTALALSFALAGCVAPPASEEEGVPEPQSSAEGTPAIEDEPGCVPGSIPVGSSATLEPGNTGIPFVDSSGVEVTIFGGECFDLADNWSYLEGLTPGIGQTKRDIYQYFCLGLGVELELNALIGHGLVLTTSPTPGSLPEELQGAGQCLYQSGADVAPATTVNFRWEGNNPRNDVGGEGATLFDQTMDLMSDYGEVELVSGIGDGAAKMTTGAGISFIAYVESDYRPLLFAVNVQSTDAAMVSRVESAMPAWLQATIASGTRVASGDF